MAYDYIDSLDVSELAHEQLVDSIDLVYDGEYETSDVDVEFLQIVDGELQFKAVITGPHADAILEALTKARLGD